MDTGSHVPARPLGITEVVLRDGHQSLLATRMRLEDMLPVAAELDRVGFWSVESWGGATFDACIRFLGEDPWERIRELKRAMPNTRQQMLLRGQNLLGYRHYADDLVRQFVHRAVDNGVDVFRIFDAMNDVRNLHTSVKAVLEADRHAQGTICYTLSPVHTLDLWLDLARRIEDLGVHSLAIKDMAGLLRPYTAEELVTRLKQSLDIPIHMQCHATTGLSTATALKAIEAGIDNVDTAISSMSMTYGHSPTESLVAILQGTERDTGLDLDLLEKIAAHFREVRKKYARFEGELRGVDSRILVAQVPGGMLTNMESQLREQGAADRFDEVLREIPRVREELGYLPLVTPTSQIVGTQAVLNVLAGERYATVARETQAVLRGEYGATPAPVKAELRTRLLQGDEPIDCRPADLLEPEFERLREELAAKATEAGIEVDGQVDEDLLTYALFPQVALKFFANRGDPEAFEAPPEGFDRDRPVAGTYEVKVAGVSYRVQVDERGRVQDYRQAVPADGPVAGAKPEATAEGSPLPAPLAGNVVRVCVEPGATLAEGDILLVLEAMKMETEVRAEEACRVLSVVVASGDSIESGDALLYVQPLN